MKGTIKLNKNETWEGHVIQVKKESLWSYVTFTDHQMNSLSLMMNFTVISGDFNIDLLKINNK